MASAAIFIADPKPSVERLKHETVALRREIDQASMFEEIVGTSAALQRVLSLVSKVAPTDAGVLITGETGTGKELVARAIHRQSRRSALPFVSVNCAAIPRDLMASELFGHEKGSFTGAIQRCLGRFELSNGGTIFLDEVGELPLEMQIALLRVLQEHEFERVGGTRSIQTNVRVIAATNRNLQAAIAAGTFRSDLFYRLNVFPIEIPPLRERRADIPVLVDYFLDRCVRNMGKNIRGINKKSLGLLQSYPWPGNIRELQNVIERSVIMCVTENFSLDETWLPQQPDRAETSFSEIGLRRPGRIDLKGSSHDTWHTWNDGPLAASKKIERLRSFFRFTLDREWVKSNVAAKMKMPKVHGVPTMPLTSDEMRKLYQACETLVRQSTKQEKMNQLRLKPLVLVMRYAGLRLSDASSLTIGQIDGNSIVVRQAKTHVDVRVPIPEFVALELAKCPKQTQTHFFRIGLGRKDHSSGGWQYRIKEAFDLAGIQKGEGNATSHRLRDTFAVELLLAGVPIERVSKLLGHSSVTITEKHYALWNKARQLQAEADVVASWANDPILNVTKLPRTESVQFQN